MPSKPRCGSSLPKALSTAVGSSEQVVFPGGSKAAGWENDRDKGG